MQSVSLPANLGINDLGITSAVVRDNGQLHVKIGGDRFRIDERPHKITSILLTRETLWCLDSDGRIHRLEGCVGDWNWIQEEQIEDVCSLNRSHDGKPLAVTRSRDVYCLTDDRQPDEPAKDTTDHGSHWRLHSALTELVQSESSPRPRSRRLSPRWLVVLAFLCGAAWLLQQQVNVNRQHHAIRKLENFEVKFRYDYEFDSNGNELKNAVVPGPEWLRTIVSDSWFVEPVSLELYVNKDHKEKQKRLAVTLNSGLPHFRKLRSVHSRNCEPDFLRIPNPGLVESLHLDVKTITPSKLRCLRNLKEIRLQSSRYTDLDEAGFQEMVDVVSTMSKLEKLDLNEMQGDLDWNGLRKLQNLKSVNIDVAYNKPSLQDFSPLGQLAQLESFTSYYTRDLAFLRELKQLKRLKIGRKRDQRDDLEALAGLTQLESLELETRTLNDLSWARNLRNLKTLELDVIWEKGRLSPDLSPLYGSKNLTEFGFSFDVDRSSVDPWYDWPVADFELLERTKLNASCMVHYGGFVAPWNAALLSGQNLRDVGKLAGLPTMNLLDLSDNQIVDPQGLNDVSWSENDRTILALAGNPVADLQSIKDLPFHELRLANTLVSNIEGLGGVTNLDISNTRVTDLSPIAKWKALSDLKCNGLKISSVRLHPEKGKFSSLEVADTLVTDLNKIPGICASVDLSRTKVTDLRPIKNWKLLTSLNLSGTPVTDFSPLRGFGVLEKLDVSETDFDDLSVLKYAGSIKELNLSGTKIRDISGLVSRFKATQVRLYLANTEVSDLSPLCHHKLRRLDLENTPVSDLSAIKTQNRQKLEWINLSGTQVRSLETLPEMDEGAELNLSRCPIERLSKEDVQKLQGLWKLTLNCQELEDVSLLGSLSQLKRLVLEDVKPSQSFEFLRELSSLAALEIVGEVNIDNLLAGVAQTERLQLLKLPANVTLDAKKHPILKQIEVHVGKERWLP